MNRTIAALKALSQESRLTLFRTLVCLGPAGLSADRLAATIDASTATLVPHLEPLVAAQLVSRQRHGRQVVYAARYDQINAFIAYLMGAARNGETHTDAKSTPRKPH
jgi:DNA-binding transcriptional ArsR family regulator